MLHFPRLRAIAIAGALSTLCASISVAAWADTRNYDLAGFEGISAADGIHMQVTTGTGFEVTAESDDPLQLELLSLKVRRGTLRAEMDGEPNVSNRTEEWKVTVRVTMPSLVKAEASAGAVFVADAMAGPDLEVSSANGSSLQISNINGDAISLDASSGAKINIANGICNALSANLSGGAFLDMKDVVCASGKIDARNGSNASVYANSVEADARSGATIDVYGTPEQTKIKSSGGGQVRFPTQE